MVHRRQPVAVARRDDEEGAVIILLALLILTLLVMVALVIDLGNARQTRRQAQNAADAAALAAAVVLDRPGHADFTRAVAAAKRYVFSNYGTVVWAGCTDADALGNKPDPGNECISFNSADKPNLVRVRIPTRSVTTFFGSVAGVNDVKVNASAIAQIPAPIPAPCGLCVLNLSAHEAVDVRGDGALTVTGNGIVVNSNDSQGQAVATGGDSSYLKADDPPGVAVVGDVGAARIQPPARRIPPPGVPDPLSGIPAPPPWSGGANDRSFTDDSTATLSPGNYHDIHLIGDTTLTLTAGTYVITGEVNVEPTSHLVGNNVTIYFTCGGTNIPSPCDSRGEPGGTLNTRTEAAGTVVLTAPGSGTYKGMALFYDRNNTAGLIVTPTFDITGTIYLASGQFKFQGGDPRSLRSMVVADTVVTTGAGGLTLDYNASQNAEVRRIPTLFR